MAAKRRKPGDWKAVANARAQVDRIVTHGHGLSNVPNMSETGSAAYRRLMAKISNRYGMQA